MNDKKNKGGRPPKPPGQANSEIVTFKLTPQLMAAFEAKRIAAGFDEGGTALYIKRYLLETFEKAQAQGMTYTPDQATPHTPDPAQFPVKTYPVTTEKST